MKTLIAVPCMDQVAAPFAQSLASLDKEGDCFVSFIIGSLIYDARNSFAKQAIKVGADYVLWLDSDMIFPQDTLKKMLRHMAEGKDIVSGLYFRRRDPYTPVIFKQLGVVDGKQVNEGYDDYPPESIFEVAACGFGCVMMKTSVLFDVGMEKGNWFEPAEGYGEDLAFCRRAKDLGYKIWCDSTIKCGHVGQVIVDENVFKSTKE